MKANRPPSILKVLPPTKEERSFLLTAANPELFTESAPVSYTIALASLFTYLADDYKAEVDVTSVSVSCRKNAAGNYTVVFHGRLHNKPVLAPYANSNRIAALQLAASHALEGTIRWFSSIKTPGGGHRLVPVGIRYSVESEIDDFGQPLPRWWEE